VSRNWADSPIPDGALDRALAGEPLHDCAECGLPIFEGQPVREWGGCLVHPECATLKNGEKR